MQTRSLDHRTDGHSRDGAHLLGQGLGYFSLGLGFAEVAAPGALAEAIGLRDDAPTRRVLQAFGAREIAAGAAVLSRRGSAVPLWARVAGDALDLAAIALAARGRRVRWGRLLFAAAAVAGVTALDVLAARRLQRLRAAEEPATAGISINRTPVQVYAAWRDLSDLPRFLAAVASVETLGEGRSRWTASAPGGAAVTWVSEITDDRPGERLAWRTVEGSEVEHEGEVTFRPAPGLRGSEVRWTMRSRAGGGGVAEAIAGAFAAPKMLADLRRFKQVMETGALVRSDASIHKGLHAAQPSETRVEVAR
jgi:uncharacterized membrane protein